MSQQQAQTIAVNSGDQVSADIALLRASHVFAFLPTVTSGGLGVQGNFDTTSAGFIPVFAKDGAAVYQAAVAAGGVCVNLTDIAEGLPYARLDLGVAQTAARSITIITWPR